MKQRKKISVLVALMVLLSVFAVPSMSYGAAKGKVVPKYTLKLNKTVYTMKKGKTVKLKATMSKAAKKKKLKWSSSNKKVATVASNGKVKAKKNGKTTITAQVKGTKVKAKCKIVVGTPVSKVKLNKASLSLKTGQTFKLKAAISPKKATNKKVIYKSSNKAVASVTAKGVVKAGSAGTAKITATAADGTGKSAKCAVTVAGVNNEVAVTSVTLDKTSLVLEPGQQDKLSATIAPANATNKNIDWRSSDPAALSVASDGTVKAIKEGNVTVTASAANGKSAVCGVRIAYKDTVSNQTELNNALSSKMISNILYQSNAAGTITIPKGDYSTKTITIDAPNAEMVNNGSFSKVTIQAIAQNTYTENSDNVIYFNALKGRMVIGVSGNAAINLSSAGNQKVDIENNGNVKGLDVPGKTELNIKGRNSVPVTLRHGAAGSLINAETTLDITSSVKWEMNILPGGENTKANVDNKQCMPEIAGLGCIPIKILDENDIINILAEMLDRLGITTKVTVAGNIMEYTVKPADSSEEDADSVAKASLDPSDAAEIYLLPYKKSNSDMEDAWETYINGMAPTATSADGDYAIADQRIGNYWMIVKKEGFAPVVKSVHITSSNSDTYSNGTISLLSDEISKSSPAEKISGKVINGLTGEPVATTGMKIKLRAGNGNMTGKVLAQTETNSEGSYTINQNVSAGVYTLEVLDLRQGLSSSETRYNSVSQDIVVAADYLATDNYNCTVNPQMQSVTGKGQVQFTLTWGTEASGASADIDSHLVGPKMSGNGNFHVYYSDKDYHESDEQIADLDVDDTDYEGPEHTTIYKETNGIYRFYIHNFSESRVKGSDMMAKSSIQVKVTIGSSSYTYNCPNKTGNLWYVCDYNSVTNTIIPKNQMSDFLEDEAWIGLSEAEINQLYLESEKESALDTASSFEGYLSAYSDNAVKQGYLNKISSWKSQINSCTSIMAVREMSSAIENEMDALASAFSYPEMTADNMYSFYSDMDYIYDDNDDFVRNVFTTDVRFLGSEAGAISVAKSGSIKEVKLTQTSTEPYTAHVTLENGLEYDLEIRIVTNYVDNELEEAIDDCRYAMIGFENNAELQAIEAKLATIQEKAQSVKNQAEKDALLDEIHELKTNFDNFYIEAVSAGDQLEDWDAWRDSDAGKYILTLYYKNGVVDDNTLGKTQVTFENESIQCRLLDSPDSSYRKLIEATDPETRLTKNIYVKVSEW